MEKFKVQPQESGKSKRLKAFVSGTFYDDDAEKWLTLQQEAKKSKVSDKELFRQMVRFVYAHREQQTPVSDTSN